MSIFGKFLGDPNEKMLKKIRPIVEDVGGFESEVEKLSSAELKQKTQEFKKRLARGEALDSIVAEAYACVREAAKRTLGQRHYDVQILGGIVLHQGRIVEMKTGEGKTLSSTAPAYLNALTGKGVHVVTVNDYLAKRDTVWMGQIYNALGLTVGVITIQNTSYVYDENWAKNQKSEIGNQNDNSKIENFGKSDEERDELGNFKVENEFLRPCGRREAYAADITYGTNNEFGFDYLRDNLAQNLENKVQRGHNFAIIDEVDSILIDEARTPLIISAPDTESSELYKTFAAIVPKFKENADYNVDYKMKAVSITEKGIDKVEKALGIENIYDSAAGGGIRYVHNMEQALKAHILFARDKDYVVKEGEVVIVDEFTGRLMPGRRYSDGLHQAIEAKEGVEVQKESRTLASISFQNYFRMYNKLSGMTGTAITSSEELDKVYNLKVVVVPTNKPLVREAYSDLVFRNQKGKLRALARDIKERHEKGQPILVGTTSIEKNEVLSMFLQKEGIKHEILNAKNHEREGAIIAQAGRLSAVTVATNMAGRGVDIILGGNPPDITEAKKVRELGGLHVIGTERHEARRIDDQLRGRAGRQGDPGSSQFYVSLEDEIMRIFGGDRIKAMMQTLKMPEDVPIESKMITNAIEGAQKRIEGYNFDTRKRLLDYDEVLNKHRKTIYKRRDEILSVSDREIKKISGGYVKNYFARAVNFHIAGEYAEDWNIKELFEEARAVIGADDNFNKKLEEIAGRKERADVLRDDINAFIDEMIDAKYAEREEEIGEENMRKAERWLILRAIDTLWMEHLEAMDYMRDDVRLRAYAQRDPLVEYKNESMRLFNTLKDTIEAEFARNLFKIHVHPVQYEQENPNVKKQTDSQIQDANNQQNNQKIGRNDPCWCGSGKKYKKCHGE
jgi:preprotein translocase subunit SecA